MQEVPTRASGTFPKGTMRGILIAIVIGLAVNIGIGLFLDHESLLENLRTISILFIIVPFLTQLSAGFIDMLRTKCIVHGVGARISWQDAFYNAFLGWFFNLVTPMAAGGQPFQIYHLSNSGLNSRRAANIILSRFVINALLMVALIGASVPVIIRISKILAASVVVFYAGLAITVIFSVMFLLILINPLIIGGFAFRSRHGKLGKFIGRVSRKPRWSLTLLQWTHKLRREIVFLWSEKKLYIIIDVFLNLALILVQGFGLYFVMTAYAGSSITFWETMATYIIIWQVVFYIPTPGASGSLEGVFTFVFAGLTLMPERSLVSVFIWRLGSYYMFIAFGLIILLLYIRHTVTNNKNGNSNGSVDQA